MLSMSPEGGGDVAELREGRGSLEAARRDRAAAFEPELDDDDEPEVLGTFRRCGARSLLSSSVSEAEDRSTSSSSWMFGTFGGRDIRRP